jgi:elongation factor G
MKKFEVKDIRNIALVGHKGCGKTSLGEALLFNSKTTTRLGSVDSKTSTFDYEPEEMDRGMTISTSFASVEWKKRKFNILDTPGDGNFIFDTRFCSTAADCQLVLVSAPDGVEVQTVRVWERGQELNMPRVVFINKMDRERANPNKALEEVQSMLSTDVIPMQVPIGREASFEGIVDILTGQAVFFEKDGSGKAKTSDIPEDLKDQVAGAKESLTEKIAESSEELLEKYLEKGELSDEEMAAGLAAGIRNSTLFPAFFGSATHNMGVNLVSDFVADHLPAPHERPAFTVLDGEEEIKRKRSENEPFLAMVIKTEDAQGGTMSIFRIMSGQITSDCQVFNPITQTDERIGSLLAVTGKKMDQISAATAGDIVAVLKLKKTSTGHTLCDKKNQVTIPVLQPEEPCISYAIKAKTKGDEDKLGTSLHRILAEDPTLSLTRHQDTKDFLLSGTGAPHIEITTTRMKRRFGVEVNLETPRVAYRETIRKKAEAQGRHKRQTGGRGQFGDVWLELSPLPRGEQFEFENRIKGGVVPNQFIPAVEKGVLETMDKGHIAGFPIVDVKVSLYDGSYHDVDSSEAAFKRAASIGFKAAMEKANPVMLEPVYAMEIVVPEENMGDIMGDMNSRRGRVLGMDTKNKRSTIKAQVPLAEILMYSPDLDSRTGGRGSFTQKFSHYQEIPQQLTNKIIAQYKPGEEDED